jgi:hypothetical protein
MFGSGHNLALTATSVADKLRKKFQSTMIIRPYGQESIMLKYGENWILTLYIPIVKTLSWRVVVRNQTDPVLCQIWNCLNNNVFTNIKFSISTDNLWLRSGYLHGTWSMLHVLRCQIHWSPDVAAWRQSPNFVQ